MGTNLKDKEMKEPQRQDTMPCLARHGSDTDTSIAIDNHDKEQNMKESQERQDTVSCIRGGDTSTTKIPSAQQLGIIFDIDGTLIAEGKGVHGIRIRPGTVEFLQWCHQRGHALALWTKAHRGWADQVTIKICQAVHPHHTCNAAPCRQTFDFCWDRTKLRRQQSPSVIWNQRAHSQAGASNPCKWCEAYSNSCHQCECDWNYQCPCQEVKDLRRVWSPYDSQGKDPETMRFVKDRTLLVENTPQNCIYNYGNAIYVPTYGGDAREGNLWEQFQRFIVEELEPCESVRRVRKCSHGTAYHACYEQSWWTRYDDEEQGL